MHSKRNNIEIMTNSKKADEVKGKLFQSLLCKYQSGLDTSMRESDFIFEGDHL